LNARLLHECLAAGHFKCVSAGACGLWIVDTVKGGTAILKVGVTNMIRERREREKCTLTFPNVEVRAKQM